MSDSKNLKSISYVKIEDVTHSELMGEASRRSENPVYFIGRVLDEAVAQGVHKFGDKNQSVFWRSRQLRKVKENRDLVRKAALGYLADPTDQGAEILADMCEDVGLDIDEVLVGTEDTRFASMKASRESVNVERADWLYKLLDANGGNLTVKYIFAAGDAMGYSNDMVVHARKFINDDQQLPDIVSIKTGKEWVWKLQDDV